MSNDEPTLSDLRDRIDSIDEEIHDLIMSRALLVDDIRKSKPGGRGGYYRPAREAEIVRRMVRRHRGRLPTQVVVRIWHELMSATVRLQGPFSLAVYSPDGSQALVDIARDHFGLSAPITSHHSAFGVVRAVRDGTATVGVLPVPEQSQEERWWPAIADAPPDMRPLVTARIPFATTGVGVSALVIGNIEHEPTGADRTYLMVRSNEPVSRARLSEGLTSAGLEPIFLDDRDDDKEPASTLFMVEVADFVSPDDDRVMSLVEDESSPAAEVMVIGGYALPLSPAELRAES